MKKIVLFLIFMVSLPVFSQTVNEWQYVIVPVKFTDFSENDQYRMNTVTKIMLQKYGFKSVFTTDSIPDEIANNNCKRLTADLVKNNNAFMTKLKIVLKDCKEKVVYETEFGTSREKSYMTAYNEALRNAFKSFDNLNYKYNGKNGMQSETATVAVISAANLTETNTVVVTNSEEFYFAQPIPNGFQVVNTEPKVIMKFYKTSEKNIFIGVKGDIHGVVISRNNQWFFEYYENSKLVSELLKLKF